MVAKAGIPDPILTSSRTFPVDTMGIWLVLSDTHFPYHDKKALELAIKEARRRKVVGVILNGDLLDQHDLSRFDKTPDDPRYTTEITMGRQFLTYLRDQFPKIRIIWKDGNHEERLFTYLITKAPALFGLDVLELPRLLDFDKHGIEYVTDRKVIRMGKLNVIHGHEYRPGIQAPVNPARGLFLRAKSLALTGHFHQTSEHHEVDITGKSQGAWSVGCLCSLTPRYMPLNKWNLGFCFVTLQKDGEFSVDNLRIVNGNIV